MFGLPQWFGGFEQYGFFASEFSEHPVMKYSCEHVCDHSKALSIVVS